MILKFRVYEQTISLQSTKAEPRQGSRDYLELQFSFSSDWNDLLKYVYIQHGEVSVPHDLVEGSVIVDEYFTEQTEFNVTLFGKSADGSIEVPTNVITVFLKESNNLWKKDAPEPQNSWIVQVVDARDEALAAAIRAENAAIHQPYPNEETGTWWVWNAAVGEYKDTGISCSAPVDATLTQNGQAADAAAVGNRLSSLSEEIDTTSESKVSAHNTGTDTHNDIRVLIQGLTDRLNALADSDDTTLDQLSEVVAYIKSNRDLISSITTDKVSVADIVDNLTTNVANKPLSAAQGVALKALIDAISIPDKLPNPNALTFTGAATGSYDGSEAKTIEIPSGGGGGVSYRSWSKVWTLAVAEDIAGFEAPNIDLDGKSEIMIVFISDSTASRTMANGRLIINGVDVGKVLFNSLPLKKDSHSFVIIGRADNGIEYTTMQATAEYQTYPWQGEVKIVHRMVSGTGSIIQWIAGSTIKITQASATLGQGVTIEIYVR